MKSDLLQRRSHPYISGEISGGIQPELQKKVKKIRDTDRSAVKEEISGDDSRPSCRRIEKSRAFSDRLSHLRLPLPLSSSAPLASFPFSLCSYLIPFIFSHSHSKVNTDGQIFLDSRLAEIAAVTFNRDPRSRSNLMTWQRSRP